MPLRPTAQHECAGLHSCSRAAPPSWRPSAIPQCPAGARPNITSAISPTDGAGTQSTNLRTQLPRSPTTTLKIGKWSRCSSMAPGLVQFYRVQDSVELIPAAYLDETKFRKIVLRSATAMQRERPRRYPPLPF